MDNTGGKGIYKPRILHNVHVIPNELISDKLSFTTIPEMKAVSGSLWTFSKQLNKKMYNRGLRNLYEIEYLQIYY